MAEFEIREIRGSRRVAKFRSPTDPGDDEACGALLKREVKARKLPAGVDGYILQTHLGKDGWRTYRP